MSKKTNLLATVDVSELDKFTDEKEIQGFNKEVENFLDGKSKTISTIAVAFFYLALHKMENEQEEKRRGLSLYETHCIIRSLQGKILTLLEASSLEERQLKSIKDIVNSYFSHSQSEAQDYGWGRFDGDGQTEPLTAQDFIDQPKN